MGTSYIFGSWGKWLTKVGIITATVVVIFVLLFCCVMPFFRSVMANAASNQMINVSVRRSGVDAPICIQWDLDWMNWMRLNKTPKAKCGREGVPFLYSLFSNVLYSLDSKGVSILIVFFLSSKIS